MKINRLAVAASLGLGLTLLLSWCLSLAPDVTVAQANPGSGCRATNGSDAPAPDGATNFDGKVESHKCLSALAVPVMPTQVVTTFSILVDDFIPQPYQGDTIYFYNRLGGDRGALEESKLEWGHGQVTATISPGHTWGGVWMSLNHPATEGQSINFSAILPYQILSPYQGKITGLTVQVASGTPGRTFRLELKDGSNLRWSKETALNGGPQTLNYDLPSLADITQLVWVLEASSGDYAVVGRVAFTATTPITDTAVAAFVWSYGMLLNNWSPTTGLVRDRTEYPSGKFDAIQATGSLAAATAVAEQLGIVNRTDAVSIVTHISNTLLITTTIPRYHGLWPHFVQILPSGTLTIAQNTEWSSVDTVIAAVTLLDAQSALGLDTSGTEQMLRAIDWDNLLRSADEISHRYTHEGLVSESCCCTCCPTSTGISHGYAYTGGLIPCTWNIFGGESWLIALAYAAATQQIAPIECPKPPTANGSGFIDELAWLFVLPPAGRDRWCTDWTSYRTIAASTQITYYPIHYPTSCFSHLGLFGLSAAEVPVPWAVAPWAIYQAFGVGGRCAPPNDGSPLLGAPVVVPHYSALVASLRPTEAISMWTWLINQGPFSPLNNVESLMFPAGTTDCRATNMQWNHLKGSWNLALQTLGWGRYLAQRQGQIPVLWQATTSNTFLHDGYRLLVPEGQSCVHLPLILKNYSPSDFRNLRGEKRDDK